MFAMNVQETTTVVLSVYNHQTNKKYNKKDASKLVTVQQVVCGL